MFEPCIPLWLCGLLTDCAWSLRMQEYGALVYPAFLFSWWWSLNSSHHCIIIHTSPFHAQAPLAAGDYSNHPPSHEPPRPTHLLSYLSAAPPVTSQCDCVHSCRLWHLQDADRHIGFVRGRQLCTRTAGIATLVTAFANHEVCHHLHPHWLPADTPRSTVGERRAKHSSAVVWRCDVNWVRHVVPGPWRGVRTGQGGQSQQEELVWVVS